MDNSHQERSDPAPDGTRAADGSWPARLAGLAGLAASAQLDVLLDLVVDQVATVTGRGPDDIDRGAAWRALGVYRDSADRLRTGLAAATGMPLPATLLFERPTPRAVAAYLRAVVLGVPEEPAGAPDPRRNPASVDLRGPERWEAERHSLERRFAELTGTDLTGTGLPGSNLRGADFPTLDLTGTHRAGTDRPGADRPGTEGPGTDRPGTDDRGTEGRTTEGRGAERRRAERRGVDWRAVAARAGDRPGTDPVVIVGMGCRLPGADSPAALWDLVAAGRDMIGELPTDRGWDLAGLYHADPDHPGTTYTRGGGFLPGIDRFDAAFFGIGPREAVAMDPQQRLMLEVTWEAFEHAGIDPLRLRGSATGVFTGVSLQDYGTSWHHAPAALQGQLLTGTAPGVIAGRVAYTFGVEGPVLTVDTQCSASLVAVHLAAASLRAGECDLAVAGGVTLMSTPAILVEFSRKRGLAADGRCRAFAADADGTGWAEGAAVVVLARLSRARALRLPVLAAIAGSAINSDGASNGLTAPSGLAQQRVITRALADAGLRPGDVDAVEAHGTGTPLGDPIEARALIAAYGAGRAPDRPLHLGSLKSNIGHTQAAAGVAGVIKMVEALRHGTLPASLHITEPTPHVDWSAGTAQLLTTPVPWPAGNRPRRAAVSAFGISGTNAHLILTEPPATPRIPTQTPRGLTGPRPTAAVDVPTTVVVSARGETALRAHAARLAEHLARHPDLTCAEVAHTLGSRAGLPTRAAIVLDGPPERRAERLARTLTALAAGRSAPALRRGTAPTGGAGPRTIVAFTGQGSQRPGMGRLLHAAYPAFARALDTVCDHFAPHLDEPLRTVMFADPGTHQAALLDETRYTQCALFAYQVALFRLLETFGLVPHAVLGHSVGELTAAHVAGIWTLPDATALVAARGRLMQSCQPGAMAALHATEDEARDWLTRVGPGLDIAAVNGPMSVVVAGDTDAVTRLTDLWAERGRPARRLAVSHAFHSAHMEPALDGFATVADDLAYQDPAIPLISALTGRHSRDPGPAPRPTEPGYWVRHIREPVRFADAIRRAGAEHPAAFLEIGPWATLTSHIHDVLTTAGSTADTTDGMASARAAAPVPGQVATAGHRQPEPTALHHALADLHTRGVPIDWEEINSPSIGLLGAPTARLTHRQLPTYPFQRRRHWMEPFAPPAGPAAAPRPTPSAPGSDAAPRTGRDAVSHHRTVWRPLPGDSTPPLAPADGLLPLAGPWLLLRPASGVPTEDVSRLSWLLTCLGGAVTEVAIRPEDADRHRLADRLRALGTTGPLDTSDTSNTPGTPGAVGAVGEPAPAAGRGGVLSLLALDPTPHPTRPTLTTGFVLSCALAQAHHDLRLPAPLWALTRGAVGTGTDDPVRAPAGALVWGLGRSVALERPDSWGGLIDLPAELDDTSLAWLGTALAGRHGEDQFAVRPTALFVPRLIPEPPGSGERLWDVPPTAVSLITGGTGALGGLIARHLADGGARRLVLTSRRGPDAPGAAELCADLTARGVDVSVRRCDAADSAQLTALVSELAADRDAPLGLIVHAAGTSGPTAPLHELDLDQIEAVLTPKAVAAERLHQVAGDVPLIFLSSIAATWGSAGQAAYSAANAYLDALAAARLGAGQPAVSVAYGPWAGSGMGAEPARRDFLQRRGLLPLAPARALAALTRTADGTTPPIITVADVDWDVFLPAFTAARPSRLLDEIGAAEGTAAAVERSAKRSAKEAVEEAAFEDAGAVGFGRLPAARRSRALRDLVRAEVAGILGHDDPHEVETDRRFLEIGFDSVASVQLSRRLATATGLRLTTTVVFEHSTVDDLAAHLDALLSSQPDTPGGLASPEAVTAPTGVATATAADAATATGTRAARGERARSVAADWAVTEPVGVRGLYRQACADGKFAAGVGVLRAAARLRPTFSDPAELPRRPRPVTLASGPAGPALLCLPSMVAPSGPHTFARLALHLHGRRAVHALAHPGFGDGELLPATADLVIDLHADTITEHFADVPVALAGYSSGGWLAHAVAARLEARGYTPKAIVLLDTWLPGDRIPDTDVAEELRGIAVNDQAFALMTEAQVTAQGAYLDLFDGWRPTPVRTPIVMVRAAEGLPRRGAPAQPVEPPADADAWALEFDLVSTVGDHQSMMNQHARSTAGAVHDWLDALDRRTGRPVDSAPGGR